MIPEIFREDGLVVKYNWAEEFTDQQNSVFWTHSEIELEKDIQDILVNMTPAERHGVITVLKLFTLYEVKAGEEYWGGRIRRAFGRHEIQDMATCFSFFEQCVHKRFYSKINELLHLHTDDFYNSYADDPVLKARMEFIDAALNDDDLLYSLGVFAMVEGAILYSNFAFIKHFQSQGKNKLMNLVAGINFSVRDENIHHLAGAMLFRTVLMESKLTPEQVHALFERLYAAADIVREHEHHIDDKIFEKGRIDGITSHQLKNFVDSRIDLCLQNLSLSARYRPTSNPIAEWFYMGISQTVIHDFFTKVGNQYNRNWAEKGFTWNKRARQIEVAA